MQGGYKLLSEKICCMCLENLILILIWGFPYLHSKLPCRVSSKFMTNCEANKLASVRPQTIPSGMISRNWSDPLQKERARELFQRCDLKNALDDFTQRNAFNEITFICGIYKIQQTGDCNKKANSQIQRINKWLPGGRGKEGGTIQGQGIKRSHLLGIK